MVSAWSTSSTVEHAVSNIRVRLLIVLDIGGTIIKWKQEKLGMENVKQMFLQIHFLQDDHKGFLEAVEFTLIDKTQGSDPTKRECYWMRTLKTLYPDGVNIESDY